MRVPLITGFPTSTSGFATILVRQSIHTPNSLLSSVKHAGPPGDRKLDKPPAFNASREGVEGSFASLAFGWLCTP